MPNIYGTKKHEDYLKECDQYFKEELGDNIEWKFDETITRKYKDYEAQLETYSLKDSSKMSLGYANLKILKNGKEIYNCKNMGYMRDLLYFYNYNGQDYLLFRKDQIYGYTLFNLETLEEINYFPSAVVDEGDAYIITSAVLFKDILIFDGCFWGGPYCCYLLDLKTYKTYLIAERLYECFEIKDNCVYIPCYDDDNNRQVITFTYEELTNLLDKSNSYDVE